MLDPRRSYLKTVLAAGLLALTALVPLGWLLLSVRRLVGDGSPVAWLLFAGAAVLLLAAVTGAGLIVVGGSIAIHRTGLEERGLPYAPRKRREWIPRPPLSWIVASGRAAAALFRSGRRPLRPGDLVEVRSLDEILPTLDDRAMLDGLPFMPEMAALCGRRFRVLRRFEKIHDYVMHTGLRRMRSAVLLEDLRCDGSGHDGCQARCHVIWKEAWLRLVRPGERAEPVESVSPQIADRPGLQGLWTASTRRLGESGEVRYVCQMTEVARATSPLSWGDPRHYLRDFVNGNVRPAPMVRGVALALFNAVQTRRGGVPFPIHSNTGQRKSPHGTLDLEIGEMVRIKTKHEIEATLTTGSRNRGLWFDVEMLRFCGGVYRVAGRVDRVIEEQSGAMVDITNPSITLEGVTATGEYLAFCPQNDVIMWREIWLERVGSD